MRATFFLFCFLAVASTVFAFTGGDDDFPYQDWENDLDTDTDMYTNMNMMPTTMYRTNTRPSSFAGRSTSQPVMGSLWSQPSLGSVSGNLLSSRIETQPNAVHNPTLFGTSMRTRAAAAAPIFGGSQSSYMRTTDESSADDTELPERDYRGEFRQSPCATQCAQLSMLDCIAVCKQTRFLARMFQRVQDKQQSSLATSEEQLAFGLWNQFIAQLSGTSVSSNQPQTFFAPSNRAVFKFYKMVKKFMPFPFNSKVAAAMMSYHLATGFTNSTMMASSVPGWNFSQLHSVVAQNPLKTALLNTALTCPAFVNLGHNIPQVLSVTKCPKTGGLVLNFGIHNAPLFTARIVMGDIVCRNGVIHIINKVMLVPFSSLHLIELAGKTSFGAALASSNLLSLVQSTPGVTILVPPSAHVDKFTSLISGDYTTSSTASTATSLLIHGLWKAHVVNIAPNYLHTLTSGTELRTMGGYSLSFRVEVDAQTGKKVFYIGGAKVLNSAISRNGAIVFIDRILEIPSVPQVGAINTQIAATDAQCTDV